MSRLFPRPPAAGLSQRRFWPAGRGLVRMYPRIVAPPARVRMPVTDIGRYWTNLSDTGPPQTRHSVASSASHFAPRCPGITGGPLGRPVFLPLSAQWRRHQHLLTGSASARLVATNPVSPR